MHSFKDKTGHQWNVELSLGVLHRINHNDTDLSNIGIIASDHNFLDAEDIFTVCLASSPFVFFVIWQCVQDQVEAASNGKPLTEEDFMNRLNSEAVNSGREALLAEIADFFPEKKILLTALTERYSKGIEIATRKIPQSLDDQWMENHIDQAMKGLKEKLAV